MGGEKSISAPSACPGTGSPPHGRGKVHAPGMYHDLIGITPAWAGKRQGCRLPESCCWDHPRMGGEKVVIDDHQQLTQGSPPHGRGKAFIRDAVVIAFRITPAWAGKRQCVAVR